MLMIPLVVCLFLDCFGEVIAHTVYALERRVLCASFARPIPFFLYHHYLCTIAELYRETSVRGVLVSLWVCPGLKAHITEPIEFGEAHIENAHGAGWRADA